MGEMTIDSPSSRTPDVDGDALHIAALLDDGRTEDAMAALRTWVESVRGRCERGLVDPAQLQSYARSTAWLSRALEQAKTRTAQELLLQRTHRSPSCGEQSAGPGWVDVSK